MITPSELEYEKVGPVFFEVDNPRLHKIAYGIQRVLRLSYARAFELQQEDYHLSPGTIRTELADENNPNWVSKQAERIKKHVTTQGSIYWLAWLEDELLGVAKTSLKPPKKSAVRPTYLNDIAAAVEGVGIGSTTLRHALEDRPPEPPLFLDAFWGNNRANNWFKRLGFETLEDQPKNIFFKIGGIAVPQIRMSAPSTESVLEKLRVKP